MKRLFGATLAAVAALAACSSDDSTSSSSSTGSSGTSGTSSTSSSSSTTSSSSSSGGGNTCGYEKDCVPSAGPGAVFCSSAPGTTAFQCCKPAVPADSAGCTKGSGGENESAATYCCTGTP